MRPAEVTDQCSLWLPRFGTRCVPNLLRSRQFGRQCVPNRWQAVGVGQVELPNIPQGSLAEASAEFRAQLNRQLAQYLRSVFRTPLTPLFLFHDLAADLPVGRHHPYPDASSWLELERDCPGVSRDTIRRVLRQMRDEGLLAVEGRGPAARWRRKETTP